MNGRTIACCIAIAAAAPAIAGASGLERPPNQLALEVGGRMPFLGLEYERWMSGVFGVGAGVGGVPCVECSIGNSGGYGGYLVLTIPLYAIVNIPVADSQAVSLSGGATLAHPGHGQPDEVFPSLGAGYELRFTSGFVLRPSLLLFLYPYADPGARRVPAQLWAGLQVGWAF